METKHQQTRLIYAGLVLIAVLHLLHVRHYFFVTDDAYISFRYVWNWSHGHGLVFNPGQRVEGYTNFLWVVLLMPFQLLAINPEYVANYLSIACSLILLGLVFFFPRLALEEKEIKPGWLIGPLFLALNRSYAVWATGGLETRLFTLLIFAAGLMAWRGLFHPRGKNLLWSVILMVLAELTRPEGALYLAVAVGVVLFFRIIQRERPLSRREIIYVCAGMALIGLHYLGRYAYYRSWFPNTFYTKVNEFNIGYGVLYITFFILEYALYMIVPLAGLYLFRALKNKEVFPWFWIMLYLPHLCYVIVLGGDHFEYRFLDPFLPLMAVLIQRGIRLWSVSVRRMAIAGALFSVFLIYYFTLPWVSGMDYREEYYPGQVPVIDVDKKPLLKLIPGFPGLAGIFKEGSISLISKFICVRAEEHRLFGKKQIEHGAVFQGFIKKGYLHQDDIISINVIGGIPYYSGLHTIDVHGLTDPVVARSNPTPDGGMFHEKFATDEYLGREKVDFVLPINYMEKVRHPNLVPTLTVSEIGPLDLNKWENRYYIVRLDDWFLSFRSTRPPLWIIQRFQPLKVPVFVYYKKQKQYLLPVPLAELVTSGVIKL